jgi:hypothetical protein
MLKRAGALTVAIAFAGCASARSVGQVPSAAPSVGKTTASVALHAYTLDDLARVDELLQSSTPDRAVTMALPTTLDDTRYSLLPVSTCSGGARPPRFVGWRTRRTLGAPHSAFVTRDRVGLRILWSDAQGNVFETVPRRREAPGSVVIEHQSSPIGSHDANSVSGICRLLSSMRLHAPQLRAFQSDRAASIDADVTVSQVRELRTVLLNTEGFLTLAGEDDVQSIRDRLVMNAAALLERDAGISLCVLDTPQPTLTGAEEQDLETAENAGASTGRLEAIDHLIARRATGLGYDLGHLLDKSDGPSNGVALTATVCTNPGKAAAETRLAKADDYVIFAHEIAHQLGAEHSFNGAAGYADWAPESGVEPASGSTLMSYAGTWPAKPTQLQRRRDEYLHGGSVGQIRDTIANVLSNKTPCGALTGTATMPPVVATPGSSKNVPPDTPLVLRAVTLDPEGQAVQVRWDEIDAGSQPGKAPPDFRSYPSTGDVRFLPESTVRHSGIATLGERMPESGRTYRFRAIARDGDGGIGFGDVSITILRGDAFLVTSPTSASSWKIGVKQRVEWSLGTAAKPEVGATHADIVLEYYEASSGKYVAKTLQTNVALDKGFAEVEAEEATNSARIRIEPLNHVFFAESAAFTIK